MTALRWLVLFTALCSGGCDGGGADASLGGDDDATGDDDDAGDDDDDTAGDDDIGDDDVSDDDSQGDDDDTAGSMPCWTVAPIMGALAILEVDVVTGEWFEVGRYGEWIYLTAENEGIALFEDTVVVPIYGAGSTWVEIDLSDGSVRSGGSVQDETVATDGVDLITFCDHTDAFCRYETFDDLVDNTPSESIEVDFLASRMTATADRLYAAWHSASDIDVYDVHSGAFIETIHLEGWDNWIHGMAVAGDELLLMRRSVYDHHFTRFDLATGALLGEVIITDMYYTGRAGGLWCEWGGA